MCEYYYLFRMDIGERRTNEQIFVYIRRCQNISSLYKYKYSVTIIYMYLQSFGGDKTLFPCSPLTVINPTELRASLSHTTTRGGRAHNNTALSLFLPNDQPYLLRELVSCFSFESGQGGGERQIMDNYLARWYYFIYSKQA